MHNSRRPLDRLTLTLILTFDLIFIGGRGIVMDYLCAKFGNFSFSRFGFIMRTDRQTDRQNYRGAWLLYSCDYHRHQKLRTTYQCRDQTPRWRRWSLAVHLGSDHPHWRCECRSVRTTQTHACLGCRANCAIATSQSRTLQTLQQATCPDDRLHRSTSCHWHSGITNK